MEIKLICFIFFLKFITFSSVCGKFYHNCEEIETFKEKYFPALEINQDMKMKNNGLPAKIKFKYPVYIKSWNMRGRSGPTNGPMDKRAGLVLEYTVKYGNQEGVLVPVETPSTHRTVFVNKGNLATPDFVTKVKLENPIKTKELRFYPQMWDGSPYMAVRVQFCIDTADKSTWKDVKDDVADPFIDKEADEDDDDEDDEDEDEDDDDDDEEEEMKSVTPKPVTAADIPAERIKITGEGIGCQTPLDWRYDGRNEIKDTFTTDKGSASAYRLAFRSLEEPFLFSADSKQEYVQVKFAAPSRLYALRTVGKGETGDWGSVTEFSMFYRDPDSKQWKYYTDEENDRRIFDMRGRTKASVTVPEEFDLPRPVEATIIRLYPHKWTAKPYLSLDIKACYLRIPYPRFENCGESLLSQGGSLVSVGFDELSSNGELSNYKVSRTLDLQSVGSTPLVTGLKIRQIRRQDAQDVIKTFVLQYSDEDHEWKNVLDDDGIIKVFNAVSDEDTVVKKIKFPEPVETGFLRLYPESWSAGDFPRVFIDVLGCTEY